MDPSLTHSLTPQQPFRSLHRLYYVKANGNPAILSTSNGFFLVFLLLLGYTRVFKFTRTARIMPDLWRCEDEESLPAGAKAVELLLFSLILPMGWWWSFKCFRALYREIRDKMKA